MGSRVRRTLPLAAAGTTIETLELPDDESRLRHSLAMTVVAALAAASSAAAQQAVPLLSVDAQLGGDLSEWIANQMNDLQPLAVPPRQLVSPLREAIQGDDLV